MNSFIRKLLHEKSIKLTQPSEQIAKSYIAKSSKSLQSAKLLLGAGNFDDATALIYYSMYNSTLALLYFCGIKSENHTGSILLLEELFGIMNKSIMRAKKERIDKQYYVVSRATSVDVEEGISAAELFNITIRHKIDTLQNQEIISIRKRLEASE